MKKVFILFLFLFLTFLKSDALEQGELKDIGIAKYAVIEARADYSPVRIAPDVNAGRFSHLRKGFVTYADKEYKNFYRVDLGLDDYYWMEKKYADIQAIIPQKHIQKIDEIKFDEDREKYSVFIPLNIQNSYSFKEVPDGLEFYLYDVDCPDIVIKNKPGSFSYDTKNNTLHLKYISPALFGYDVIPHKKGLVLMVKKPPQINRKKPLKGRRIVLDAGHGGEESGVCAFGHKEKDVNLKISKQTKKALSKKGAKVYMTRKKDKYVPLYDRVAFAQEKKADILLSIHQNSLPNPKDVTKKHGVGVYYYNNQAYALANSIQKSLLKQTGFRDDGVNFASFALTRPTYPVSALVECGYLIDKNEMEKLTNKKFQKELARALALGAEDYLRYLIVF